MKSLKTKPIRAFLVVLIVLASTLLFAAPALAYIDPATTTLIIQTIAAAFFGSLYFVKLNWMRLKGLFKGKGTETESASDGDQVEK